MIDPLKVELLMRRNHGSQERDMAEKVQPVLNQHHRLLVTLLLANAAAMEALPLFLNVIVPGWLAILLSVTFVLIFGEVIPQALCTKNPLKIGAKCVWLVRSLMLILSPVSYPIAWVLDKILGHSDSKSILFKISELKSLLDIQAEARSSNAGDEENLIFKDEQFKRDIPGLSIDEAVIMKGALDLNRKTASNVMIPSDYVYMIKYDSVLNLATLEDIKKSGFSRVPVFCDKKNNIKGVLLTSDLILVNPLDSIELKQVPLRDPVFISPWTSLMDLLNLFQNLV
jgi:CBS domain containing-hemolysin-like protein